MGVHIKYKSDRPIEEVQLIGIGRNSDLVADRNNQGTIRFCMKGGEATLSVGVVVVSVEDAMLFCERVLDLCRQDAT